MAERGKEFGAKGWSFIKGVYGTVANQVETVAKDNGYKLDLGAPSCMTRTLQSPLRKILVKLLYQPLILLPSYDSWCQYWGVSLC